MDSVVPDLPVAGVLPLMVKGLTKQFDHRAVVDELDLTIRPGELYALLGPNGAGKTTTMRMVAGLLQPTSGAITVFGIDALSEPERAKQLIAWLPDEPLLYDKLTPIEYLEFVAALWGVPAEIASGRAEDLLKGLELWENRGDRCETFSRGMKQKAVLAGALIHDPQLMLLDEPLTGLDASIARHVKDMLRERAQSGHSIILTTHILEVAERLADRIGIISQGRLLAEGTLEELRARFGSSQSSLEDVFLQLVSEPQLS
ncbi:MAG: ABC transporter ATP-binding protein [Alphaproteobacteria bacterium]